MYTYVKKLQSKSEDSRKRILVGSLVLCMSFVVFIWVVGLGSKFYKEENIAKENTEIKKPFALLKESFSNTLNNLTASTGNIPIIKKEVTEQPIAETKQEKEIDLTVVEYQ